METTNTCLKTDAVFSTLQSQVIHVAKNFNLFFKRMFCLVFIMTRLRRYTLVCGGTFDVLLAPNSAGRMHFTMISPDASID